MASKEYSTFPKDPGLKTQHQISVISGHSFGGGLTPLQTYSQHTPEMQSAPPRIWFNKQFDSFLARRISSCQRLLTRWNFLYFYPEGVAMIVYLEKGKVIHGQYYTLRSIVIKSKRRGKLRADVLLLQDNAPVHTSLVVIAEVAKYRFELLPYPFIHHT